MQNKLTAIKVAIYKKKTNIYIKFGTKSYRQFFGLPMVTNCTPLIADLFLFCYEIGFMAPLSDDKQDDNLRI